MSKTEQFIEAARGYMGTRFHHQGRVKGVGVDCVGLVVCALREVLTREIPDVIGYSIRPDGIKLKQILDQHLKPVKFAVLQPGDIILFKIKGVVPQHVAIVSSIKPAYIVHAYSVARKVTEHILDDTWKSKIIQCYRVPWLEE